MNDNSPYRRTRPTGVPRKLDEPYEVKPRGGQKKKLLGAFEDFPHLKVIWNEFEKELANEPLVWPDFDFIGDMQSLNYPHAPLIVWAVYFVEEETKTIDVLLIEIFVNPNYKP